MKKLLAIFFLLFFAQKTFCQQDSDTAQFEPRYRHGVKYIFKTSAGTVFKGFVTGETKDFITVTNRDVHESYDLRKSEISSTKLYSDRESYDDTFGENYHARSYMFASSAFLFREGKLTTNSHWLLIENFDYALSENWGITATTLAFYPVSLGVKCAYEIGDKIYLGANVFGIGNLGSSGGSPMLGYGAMAKFTKGTSNNNFTVFGGLLGISSEAFLGTRAHPYVNNGFMGIGYCNRISKRIALNAEGWYMPEALTGLGGIGIKLVGNETVSWSFGCYALISQANNTIRINYRNLPIPYIGVSRNFN